jgi:hypothetical protein
MVHHLLGNRNSACQSTVGRLACVDENPAEYRRHRMAVPERNQQLAALFRSIAELLAAQRANPYGSAPTAGEPMPC